MILFRNSLFIIIYEGHFCTHFVLSQFPMLSDEDPCFDQMLIGLNHAVQMCQIALYQTKRRK